MRIIKFFKEMREFSKMLKELPKEAEQRKSDNESLTTEELAAIPDDDLLFVVIDRIESVIDDHEELSDGLAALSGPQKVVYAVNELEVEVNNGGLCQFFVNSSRAEAPYISDALAAIGAKEHKELFDGFVGKYKIDVNDLSSFAIRRVKDFEKQAKRYPFDEYDDKFYTLPSLQEPLTAYIREHLNEF